MAETETITDTIEGLRKELDEVTEARKAAAERARYIRHAINNLEAAQAHGSAQALTEDPAAEDKGPTDWR